MYQPHSRYRILASSLALLVMMALAGCQAQPASAPPAVPAATGAIEACAANLHDLCGYMLQFYVLNGRLPETLNELAPMADFDRELPRVCPVSGQEYVYVPEGLRSPTERRWLLLYEPVAHDGVRNAILGAEPQGNQPMGLWVVQLNETSFRSFRRIIVPLEME